MLKSKLIKNLKLLYSHITRRRRLQLIAVLALMFMGAVSEIATLGSAIPFLALLSNTEVSGTYLIIKSLYSVLGTNESNKILIAAAVFSLIAILAATIRILLSFVMYRLTFGIGADLSLKVYQTTINKPYRWHASQNSSEIIAGIQKVDAVTYGLIVQLAQGIVAFVISASILVALIFVDPFVATTSGIGLTFFYLILARFTKTRLQKNSVEIAKIETLRTQIIQEGLGGIRDIVLSGSQESYANKFARVDYQMRLAQTSNAFISAFPRYFIEATAMIIIAIITYLMADAKEGIINSIPTLGALAIGAQRLIPQMQIAYLAFTNINGNSQQLRDVLELLNHNGQLVNNTKAENVNINSQANSKINKPLIAFHDVKFKYNSASKEVFSNVNFVIEQGSITGIIGRSGVGKSTLLDLVMGLLDPDEGKIEINGVELTDANRKFWQSKISHVSQNIFLKDSTIAENIAFGSLEPDIDYDRVRIAAEKAHILEFILSLRDKFETKTGERGIQLSGGQRQRIALARAFYRNSNVFILDEATSALDLETEKEIIKSFENLNMDVTIILVSHRISTLRKANKIIKIEDFKTELMKN